MSEVQSRFNEPIISESSTPRGRRKAILGKVDNLVNGPRPNTYGDASKNFVDIAQVLNVILAPKLRDTEQDPLTADDVAKIMIATKLCRLMATPLHEDTWLDIIGYGTCGAAIADEEREPPF
jgi:hypothetical protein